MLAQEPIPKPSLPSLLQLHPQHGAQWVRQRRLSPAKAPDEVRVGDWCMFLRFSAHESILELPSYAWPAPSLLKRVSSGLS